MADACDATFHDWRIVDDRRQLEVIHLSEKWRGDFMGTWGSGQQYNLTNSSTWSSNQTSVATVGSNNGMVTGVSAGSPTISALAVNEPVQAGYICYGNGCPISSFQNGAPGSNCDFTVTPANVLASNCTGMSQNSNNFIANIIPSASACFVDQVKSSCSEKSTGTIDFVVGSPHCVFNQVGVTGSTVTYFAGPKLADGTAGTILMKFNLVFNQTEVTETGNATVECP